MLYSLYAPMWRTNETLRKLLKEVLGYSDDEIRILESENFGRNIANNLTIEQARDITKIFGDNDFQMYLNDGTGVGGAIAWNQLGIDWADEQPKEHYCDVPLISRDHLADLSIPKKIDPPVKGYIIDTKPTITCPTCQSTNVQKIGTGERIVSVVMLGLFSKKINKSFKCKNCGYTW